MATNHYKSSRIHDITQQVAQDWKKLTAASTDKGILYQVLCVISDYYYLLGLKLKQALDLQLFQRAGDEQFTWISEAEKQLEGEDIGKDLQSVRFLLKKHEVCTYLKLSNRTLNFIAT